jgi:SPP1 family predicted phage head-tail adaptor
MSLQRLSQRGSGPATAIGAMNRQITIQTRATTNSDGQPDGPWTDVVTIWAKNEHTIGKEVVSAAAFTADITDIWTTPYVEGIEPRMRVNYSDPAGKLHYYDILFVQNIEERGFFLQILAKEIFSLN